jgi:hypothetical protein
MDGAGKMHTKFELRNLRGREHFRDLVADGRII